jgi:hypothetical protein
VSTDAALAASVAYGPSIQANLVVVAGQAVATAETYAISIPGLASGIRSPFGFWFGGAGAGTPGAATRSLFAFWVGGVDAVGSSGQTATTVQATALAVAYTPTIVGGQRYAARAHPYAPWHIKVQAASSFRTTQLASAVAFGNQPVVVPGGLVVTTQVAAAQAIAYGVQLGTGTGGVHSLMAFWMGGATAADTSVTTQEATAQAVAYQPTVFSSRVISGTASASAIAYVPTIIGGSRYAERAHPYVPWNIKAPSLVIEPGIRTPDPAQAHASLPGAGVILGGITVTTGTALASSTVAAPTILLGVRIVSAATAFATATALGATAVLGPVPDLFATTTVAVAVAGLYTITAGDRIRTRGKPVFRPGIRYSAARQEYLRDEEPT